MASMIASGSPAANILARVSELLLHCFANASIDARSKHRIASMSTRTFSLTEVEKSSIGSKNPSGSEATKFFPLSWLDGKRKLLP